MSKSLRDQFLEWNNEQKKSLPQMTRTQSIFLDFMLENIEEIPNIGDVEIVFKYVVQFKKEKKDEEKDEE